MNTHNSKSMEVLLVNTKDMVGMFADIERLRDGAFARKWISLPATREELQATLREIGIDGAAHTGFQANDYRTGIEALDSALPQFADLNELNYLAARMAEMPEPYRETFQAVIESGRYCGCLKEMINITHNLECFDLQPAYSAEQFGEFLAEMGRDEFAGAIEKLLKSHDPDLRELVPYIERLEAHFDSKNYALDLAAKENGVFTGCGYLTEYQDFQEVYKGPQDIPAAYRVFAVPENKPLPKVENTDLTAFLAKVHAAGGEYMADMHHNLNVLEAKRSAEYLMLMNGRNIYLTEAAHAYRRGSDAFDIFINAAEAPGTKAFALHVTDMHSGNVAGDIVGMDVRELQLDILGNSIHPIRIDATPKFGPDISFTPEEWAKLEPIDRDRLQSWTRRFDPAGSEAVIRHLEEVSGKHAEQSGSVEANALLQSLNALYMEAAENPQPGMLRIPLAAAKDMLSHGDAPVYRLLPEGAKELSPLDAMQSRGGLWYENFREFAVKKDDAAGLRKFADRQVDAHVAGRRPDRAAPDRAKPKEPEL